MFAPSYDALYAQLRGATPAASENNLNSGDVPAAIAAAPAGSRLDVWYEYPFQSHACMGPACAVAEVGRDFARVWMGGQKPYPLRKAVAEMAGLPVEQVRVSWLPGPGSYGMNDADDAAMDAALVAQEIGKPVRLQYMRADATGWDPKGPPSAIRMRGAIDANGEAVAYDFESHGYSGRVRPSGTDGFGDTLAAQLIGGHKANSSNLFQLPSEAYQFANKRRSAHLVDWSASLNTGLRTAHLRDPDGMATCFASECFIDEMAHAARMDAVAFRLKHLSDARHRSVVKAAAERAGWQARRSASALETGSLRHGRGIAYAPRGGTVVAIVAEVEINVDSGKLRVTRFVAAHDSGFVINPFSLTGTVEANLMQAMSRAMFEAVQFDQHNVNSVDWVSYPILDIKDVPDQVEVVIVNNLPEMKSGGAGEPATRPVAAAIGNAIFDATGVRIRRVPFTAEALKAAFNAARRSPASA
jgi:CO/xanthine dehydrogenase Mo-binding subunit